MTDDTLNAYLSLPVCPECDGCGYQPEEVLYGNTLAVTETDCDRCHGLGRLEPKSEGEALVIAAELYAEATYVSAWD